MPIWKLTPTSQQSDRWRSRDHKGKVIIRAASEEAARAKASSVFSVAAKEGPVSAPPAWSMEQRE